MPERANVASPKLNDADAFAPFAKAVPADNAEFVERRGDDVDWREKSAAGMTFEAAVFVGAALARSKFPDVALRDVRLDRCDLSNADWAGGSLVRSEILGTKLIGFASAESRWRDVLVRKSPGRLAVFQQTRFDSCRFEECDLAEATFEGATLKNVVFRECDLAGVRFVGATLENVDLRGSRIDGLHLDPASVAGLIIDPTQAPIVAALAGARIEEVPKG